MALVLARVLPTFIVVKPAAAPQLVEAGDPEAPEATAGNGSGAGGGAAPAEAAPLQADPVATATGGARGGAGEHCPS